LEIEQLKTRIESLWQTNINNEKLTSSSDTSQIGIKNDSIRDNTLAWNVYEHQQGEVNIHSFYLLPSLSEYELFSYLFCFRLIRRYSNNKTLFSEELEKLSLLQEDL
jgi:hypothetical protein